MRKFWKIFSGILAGLLAVVLAASLVGWMFIGALQPVLERQTLEKYLSRAYLTGLVGDISIGGDNILTDIVNKTMESQAVEDMMVD